MRTYAWPSGVMCIDCLEPIKFRPREKGSILCFGWCANENCSKHNVPFAIQACLLFVDDMSPYLLGEYDRNHKKGWGANPFEPQCEAWKEWLRGYENVDKGLRDAP